MKTASVVGILLVINGVISLAYQGITYTPRDKKVDVGPIEVYHTEHKTIPLPPILGAVSVVAGAALLFGAGKNH